MPNDTRRTPPLNKRVTVAVTMDMEFVRMLSASVTLSNLGNKDEITAIDQLALTILLEARGAHEEQVHASILPVWRPHLEVASELRKVEEQP